ncbi:B2 protein [Forsythia ovata]|uniref:B2 protein n=1 Tax=Forsythia ovata TaxID=205694 RepID=A0ABD1UWK9_9LAMI
MMSWKDQFSGYIFMCNGKTKPDCIRYRVLGLPAARIDVVKKIKPHMKLFLFDFDLKLLHGIYTASSNGELGIVPTAFEGKFPAQVKFEILNDCFPLPESVFKHAIKENYHGGSKFRQELTEEQVTNLMSMFRPLITPLPVTVDTQPGAELSASYDLYLAKLQLSGPGMLSSSQHVQQPHLPLGLLPNASRADAESPCLGVQSDHLLPVVPKGQHDPCFSVEAHPAYNPENPTLVHPRMHGSNTSIIVPNDSKRGVVQLQAARPPTAAYWAAVASEDPNRGYLSQSIIAKYSNYTLAPGDTLHDALQPHPPSHVNVRLPYSSFAAFSGPHQSLQQGSTSMDAGNVPISDSVAAVNSSALQSDWAYGSNNNITVSDGHNFLTAHSHVPSQTPVPSHGFVHPPSSSEAAAYWIQMASQHPNQVNPAASQMSSLNSGVYGDDHSYGASVVNGTFQVYGQVPPQDPAALYGRTQCPSSVEAAAFVEPNQVDLSHYQAPPHSRIRE